MAHKVSLYPNTQHHVLVTTKFRGLLTTKLRMLRSCRQHTLATKCIEEVSHGKLFFVLVSNVFRRELKIHKNMKIAHKVILPSVIHAVDTVDRKTSLTETPVRKVNFIASKVYASGKAPQQHLFLRCILDAHLKPSESRKKQSLHHTRLIKSTSNNKRITGEMKSSSLTSTSH